MPKTRAMPVSARSLLTRVGANGPCLDLLALLSGPTRM